MNKIEIRKYKIIRETSKYNKYIKWFAECYREDNSLLSRCGYRTEKEARHSVNPSHNPLYISHNFVTVKLIEIL